MTPPADKPPLSQRRRWTVWLMLALVAVGTLLQLTLRDAWEFPSSAFFYVLPRPVLAALAWLATGLARKLTRRELLVALTVATVCLGWTLRGDMRWTKPTAVAADGRSLRVAVWNAAHLPRGRAVAAAWIQKWDADIVGVVEAGPTYPGDVDDWMRLLPGYEVVSPRLQSLVIARGNIQLHEVVKLAYDSEAMPATVTLDGIPVEVMLVDIFSSVQYGRSRPLRKLFQVLEETSRPAHLVMGDFNTPPESVWLDPMRRQYRSVFDAAGVGYRPTWPCPIPSLQLDYIWASPAVTVDACRHGWTAASDHRPVFATVRIATTPPPFPDSVDD